METPTTPSSSANHKKNRSRLHTWTLRLLRIILIVYIGLSLMLYFLQKKIIFPGAASQGLHEAIYHPNPDEELLTLRAKDGTPIAAIFAKALLPDGHPLPDSSHCPTLLYFYGNGLTIADSSSELDRFRRLGVNVIIPDFEGYGMSGGTCSEAGCYAAGDAAYAYLQSRTDIDPKKIIAAGWSLGAGTAVEIASHNPVAALITFSAFTSMDDMGRLTFPWLPTSLLLRHHFNNLAKIPRVTCPILIVHGTDDSLVPYEMSNRLAAAVAPGVTRISIQGAGHNDLFDTGGDTLDQQLKAFIDKLQ
jgi:uncharacterized protein